MSLPIYNFFKLLIIVSEAVSLKYLRNHLLNIPRFNEKLVIIALNSSRDASQPSRNQLISNFPCLRTATIISHIFPEVHYQQYNFVYIFLTAQMGFFLVSRLLFLGEAAGGGMMKTIPISFMV